MKHAAFLLPVLLLFGCSKSGTDTKLDPSTVNYQMRATVNGQPWTNASWDNSNLAVTWSKDSSRPVAFWRIKAQNLLRAESIEFSVIYNIRTTRRIMDSMPRLLPFRTCTEVLSLAI